MTTFLTLGLLSGKCSHGANMTINDRNKGGLQDPKGYAPDPGFG